MSQNTTNSKILKQSERIDPAYYFKKVQGLCFKKCFSPETASYDNIFSIAEKSCVDRCVFKFREAEEFGYETFQFFKLKVKEAQEEI